MSGSSRIISPVASSKDSSNSDTEYHSLSLSTTFFANVHTPKFSPINVNLGIQNNRFSQNVPLAESANDEIIDRSPRRIFLDSSLPHNGSMEGIDFDQYQMDTEQDKEQEPLETSNHNREETEEERRLREEAESEALARQLMAEEAMASYHESANFLHENAHEYSEEDLAALRAIMAQENPVIGTDGEAAEYEDDDDESEELSYEALLYLGERIGDVKAERWALKAKNEISKLPVVDFCHQMSQGKDENDSCVKCLVCQFEYQEKERVRILPCGHYFHQGCVDQWLLAKDFCPYCRQSIVKESDESLMK
jgi:RING-finger-containing ubiquitin ligase